MEKVDNATPQTGTGNGQTLAQASIGQAVEETLRQVKEVLRQVEDRQAVASPIVGFGTLLERLKDAYAERNLRELIKDGTIPAIRPPGSRKLAFYWPGVVEALRRFETGGSR